MPSHDSATTTLPADVTRRLRELETLYESLATLSSTLDVGIVVRKLMRSSASPRPRRCR